MQDCPPRLQETPFFGPDEFWHVHDVARADGPSDRLYFFGYGSHGRPSRNSDSNGFGCLAEGDGFGNDGVLTVYPHIPVVHRLTGNRVEMGEPNFRREFVVICPRRDVAEAAVNATVQRILLEHAAEPGWVVEVRLARCGASWP